jgi:glycosyltransferase involved in cell wall biosynthesis
MHKLQGHDVEVIASCETYGEDLRLKYTDACAYNGRDGVRVTRIKYSNWIPGRLKRKLRVYKGLRNELERAKPDLIFVHDGQFWSIRDVSRYAKMTGCRVIVDCHADGINSARNWISKNILHRVIYRSCFQNIRPWAEVFFGTLPLRCAFLQEMYQIPSSKIRLLEFGADDSLIPAEQRLKVRGAMRRKLGISENSLVIISGGKIDHRKGFTNLFKAFRKATITEAEGSLCLVVFGKPSTDQNDVMALAGGIIGVHLVGWLNPLEIQEHMIASDIALFPGTHSVLWEEAAGLGLPLIVRYWLGIDHLDKGGNCRFMSSASEDEIYNEIKGLVAHKQNLARMSRKAAVVASENFSYSSIARRAIAHNAV